MRKHGSQIKINFEVSLPVNVCKNTECLQEFIILNVRDNGDVWEQVGNRFGGIRCPYCGEIVLGDVE